MNIAEIKAATSDDAIFNLIARELEARLPPRYPIEPYVTALQSLPRGLRAMAATYELDVSLALDDLGWHFGNWHHEELAQETIQGLRELGAVRMAELVTEAFAAAQRFWSELGSPNWSKWYNGSELEKLVDSLNAEAWDICSKSPMGLLTSWLEYARRHPENLLDSSG